MKTVLKLSENIKTFISKFNLDKSTDLPIKLRYQSKLIKFDPEKPVALIIGELHPGANIKTHIGQINYFRSNMTITKFLLELYRNKTLELGVGLKEGCSFVEASPDYENYSLDDFLLNSCSPIITCLNLLDREGLQVKFTPSESEALLSMFSILSFLLTGFPNEVSSPLFEEKRILEIISNFSAETIKFIPVQLREMSKELYLTKEPFSNLVRTVKTDYGFDLLSLKHSNSITEQMQDVLTLQALIKSKLKALCYERDKFITMNFMKFESGIHPIVVGELHTENLVKLLEEQGVYCIYLSSL